MHPFIRWVAQLLDRGPFNESEIANFGLAGCLTAVLGIIAARKDRRWWPLVACSLVGLLLALGPALKLNGHILPLSLFRPVNSALWAVGHRLKPALFPQGQPPDDLADAIPLPGMLPALLAPFWEGARVVARFAFVAAIGLFPLMGLAVESLKPFWLRTGLALILLFEFLPAPTLSVPAQPPTHPAFAWLQSQDLAGEDVIDLDSIPTDRLEPMVSGVVVFATLYHHQATVSGVGSYTPAHYLFLRQWFENSVHPLANAELAQMMRWYRVRYLIVHLDSGQEQALVEDARFNPELGPAQCFDPPAGASPWPYRICILEVLARTNPSFNVIRRAGWSSAEPWGTWIEGQQASADWVATAATPQQINITLLPICLPGRRQHVTLAVNAVVVADHTWDKCETWPEQISVAAGLVQIGWNHLSIQADLAEQPVNPANGQITDSRRLSVAATQLLVGQP